MFVVAGCGKATGQAVAFECSSYADGELNDCDGDYVTCSENAQGILEQYNPGCLEGDDGETLLVCMEQCIQDDSYRQGCVITCVDEMDAAAPEEVEVPIDYVSQEPACGPGLTECKESDGSSACWDLTNSDNNCGKCGNKCIEGATCLAGNCVSGGSGPAKLGCSETDSGINNYKKGILTTPEGKEFTDFCVESEAYPYDSGDGSSLNAVYEYYCFNNVDSSKDNMQDSGTLVTDCKDGCKDGACVANEICFTMLEGDTYGFLYKGKSYEMTLTFVDEDETKWVVNGFETSKLKKGESVALPVNTLFVKNLVYQSFAGGVHQATACISDEKANTNKGELSCSAGWTKINLWEGEQKSGVVSQGKKSDVELSYVSSDEVAYVVNGEKTSKLKIGEIHTFSDGKSKIETKEIQYQAYAGGVHSATFCFK